MPYSLVAGSGLKSWHMPLYQKVYSDILKQPPSSNKFYAPLLVPLNAPTCSLAVQHGQYTIDTGFLLPHPRSLLSNSVCRHLQCHPRPQNSRPANLRSVRPTNTSPAHTRECRQIRSASQHGGGAGCVRHRSRRNSVSNSGNLNW